MTEEGDEMTERVDDARNALRSALLEAEPDELRGIGDGVVASAVREDPEVARLAGVILAGQARLHSEMTRMDRGAGRSGTGARAGARWAAVAVLAAAAATAGLLITGQWGSVGSPLEEGTSASAGGTVADGPAMGPVAGELLAPPTVEAEGPFVVFPTRNPNITVVWLLPEGAK